MRHYQNLYAIHHSDGLPSQLTFDFPVQGRDMVRIIENERRRFELILCFLWFARFFRTSHVNCKMQPCQDKFV